VGIKASGVMAPWLMSGSIDNAKDT